MFYACWDDMEEQEPSPLFEISYNDDFPLENNLPNDTSFDSICSFGEDENLHLNHGFPSSSNNLTATEFHGVLVDKIKPIYADILDKDNLMMHYNLLGQNPHRHKYLKTARGLQIVDPAGANEEQRLAFFVNVYNMMMVHMTHKYGPPQDLWQRRKFVNTTYYQIHEHKYSLHSILNGILRSNRKGHGMLWKPFGKEDLRLPLILSKCEPLVHFAIISGTKSSPALRLYDFLNVREQMKENAVSYLLDDRNLLVDTKRQTLYLPKVFKWYAVDFGNSQNMSVEWILNLLEENESDKSKALREMCYNTDYSVEYTPYDWEFNGIDGNHD